MWHKRLDAVQNAAEIHINNPLPICDRRVEQINVPSLHPSIIEQEIHFAEALQRPCEQPLEIRELSHIGLQSDKTTRCNTICLQLCGRRCECLFVNVADHHIHAQFQRLFC